MKLFHFPLFAVLEIAFGIALAILGLSLPGARDVTQSFDAAQRITIATEQQIRLLRDQVTDLRRSDVRKSAEHLRDASRTVTGVLRNSQVDFDTVRAIRDAAGQTAEGLDSLASSIDPGALGQLGAGLGATADLLDREVVPGAESAARCLETSASSLRASTRQFAELVKAAPLDLKPVRELYEGLGRFDDGLDLVNHFLDPKLLEGLRQGTQGSEKLLNRGAQMAEKVASYTYPASIALEGVTPKVKYRQFWPEGAEIGAEMHHVATGIAATSGAIETIAQELPRIQGVINESRRSIRATRGVLAAALARQAEFERLISKSPARVAQFSEELPRMTADLARALRSAAGLNNVAIALRRSRREIDAAVANWRQLRGGLTGAAGLLRGTRDQMDQLIRRRPEYEAAQHQVGTLAAEFTERLPAFTDGLNARLEQEDRTLMELDRGVDQATLILPTYSRLVSRCLDTTRVIAWVLATAAWLHGLYLFAGSTLRGRRAPQPG